ncbi:unnamed protein product [Gemmataceae bacterium]|nr:unnamed protein product [Gemmataceae bacterium]VTU02772.1 unnamed protein product [Gemmataceae bacterium]
MAIRRIIQRWQDRGATTDEKGVKTFTRAWTVETTNDDTEEPEVIDAVVAQYPWAGLYMPLPCWPWAVCRKLSAAPHEGPQVWLVTADFSTAPFEAKGDGTGTGGTEGAPSNSSSPSPSQSNSTPADQRPPTVSITRKEVTKPLEYEARPPGDPAAPTRVSNTLGDPFVPVPEVMRSNHIVTWKFHRLPEKLLWDRRSTWQDTINADEVTLFGRKYAPHSLRCTDYSFTTVWETGTAGMSLFFELTCQAEYNPDLWDVRILNTGRRKRIGGSIGDPDNPPRLVAIVDAAGQPVADPVPLDAAGVPVEPGGTYHYVTVAGYLEYNWRSDVNGKLDGPGGILS